MQLRQLEMLLQVVRHSSLSAAATELGLTQPAVSVQMKTLAEEIGVPLFEPRGRRLEPTAAGASLAEYAGRILRLVDDARVAARRGIPGATVVRVAASSTPGALLTERIGSFQRRDGAAAVRLEVRNSRIVEDLVRSGQVDLGIIGGRRTNPALQSEHWCDDELVFIVAPNHRLARRRSVRPQELTGETLLVRESGSATRATLEAAFLRAQLVLPESQVLGDTEALKNAVAAGLGIACVSPFSIRPDLAAGRLHAVRIPELELDRPLSILHAPGREAEPVARFVEFLRTRRPQKALLRKPPRRTKPRA